MDWVCEEPPYYPCAILCNMHLSEELRIGSSIGTQCLHDLHVGLGQGSDVIPDHGVTVGVLLVPRRTGGRRWGCLLRGLQTKSE